MKIITAHIKKACAEKRIIMEKIKKNVSNIKIKDPGSAITHFIAMLMALFAATPLIIKALSAPDTIHVISLSIFIGTMILLYAASTTYHTVNATPGINKILKKLDHCMISVMIAGSYTPVCLVVLHNKTGYALLALVWGIAIVGIIFKLCWVTCPKWVSSVLYIVMGWVNISLGNTNPYFRIFHVSLFISLFLSGDVAHRNFSLYFLCRKFQRIE